MANVIEFFVKNPECISTFISNIYLVLLNSDYNVQYIRTEGQFASGPLHFVADLGTEYLRFAGYIFLILSLAAIAIRPRRIKLMALYLFFGAPLFAVLGDGFYEFEKHMVAYFMLIPMAAFFLFHAGDNLKNSESEPSKPTTKWKRLLAVKNCRLPEIRHCQLNFRKTKYGKLKVSCDDRCSG